MTGELFQLPKLRRPVIRYHGGKWRLAPWIISHFPEHKIYCEPFGGAASVLLRKPRSYAEVYNDLDGAVVNLFHILRDPPSAGRLCELINLTPFARTEFDQSYEPTDCLIEQARRLVARSFMGFGSGSFNEDYSTGFRAYSKQTGRTPSKDWDGMPEALRAVAARFKGVTIESRDALEIIAQQDTPDTLFYVDPPYLKNTRPNSNHRQYKFELTGLDHALLCRALARARGKVVLSGYDNLLYSELLAGWRTDRKDSFAGGSKGRVARTEVLWMNYPASVPSVASC